MPFRFFAPVSSYYRGVRVWIKAIALRGNLKMCSSCIEALRQRAKQNIMKKYVICRGKIMAHHHQKDQKRVPFPLTELCQRQLAPSKNTPLQCEVSFVSKETRPWCQRPLADIFMAWRNKNYCGTRTKHSLCTGNIGQGKKITPGAPMHTQEHGIKLRSNTIQHHVAMHTNIRDHYLACSSVVCAWRCQSFVNKLYILRSHAKTY